MDKAEAIEKTIRHIIGIVKVWVIYYGLQSKFPKFFTKEKGTA